MQLAISFHLMALKLLFHINIWRMHRFAFQRRKTTCCGHSDRATSSGRWNGHAWNDVEIRAKGKVNALLLTSYQTVHQITARSLAGRPVANWYNTCYSFFFLDFCFHLNFSCCFSDTSLTLTRCTKQATKARSAEETKEKTQQAKEEETGAAEQRPHSIFKDPALLPRRSPLPGPRSPNLGAVVFFVVIGIVIFWWSGSCVTVVSKKVRNNVLRSVLHVQHIFSRQTLPGGSFAFQVCRSRPSVLSLGTRSFLICEQLLFKFTVAKSSVSSIFLKVKRRCDGGDYDLNHWLCSNGVF